MTNDDDDNVPPNYYFTRDGKPLASRAAAMALFNGDRTVRRTELSDGGFLSTVFLVINHAFRSGAPVLFESMKFPEQEICSRYSTEEEAISGHELLLAALAEDGITPKAKRKSKRKPKAKARRRR